MRLLNFERVSRVSKEFFFTPSSASTFSLELSVKSVKKPETFFHFLPLKMLLELKFIQATSYRCIYCLKTPHKSKLQKLFFFFSMKDGAFLESCFGTDQNPKEMKKTSGHFAVFGDSHRSTNFM